MSEEMTIYQQGYNAFQSGVCECPYQSGDSRIVAKNQSWWEGWYAAAALEVKE